jgi:hypothetical protein
MSSPAELPVWTREGARWLPILTPSPFIRDLARYTLLMLEAGRAKGHRIGSPLAYAAQIIVRRTEALSGADAVTARAEMAEAERRIARVPQKDGEPDLETVLDIIFNEAQFDASHETIIRDLTGRTDPRVREFADLLIGHQIEPERNGKCPTCASAWEGEWGNTLRLAGADDAPTVRALRDVYNIAHYGAMPKARATDRVVVLSPKDF